ncbi:hypothetical protein [Natronohydrobacter thiooxidans]|jgi:hypothetical protein|uniref:DUF7742 family protein n=1 Tax=Natronohydrobacter thiooxidans TaxID=87172 RepID=UPI0008FF68B7|nr:hypothetical protein [Natronohydrobacter thiooxidans]
MREITHGDIRVAARVLIARPEPEWPALMARLLEDAHHADRYRKAQGRHHPRLGNGTLMSAAFGIGVAPEPLPSDSRYLAAIRAVIEAVLDWRLRQI